MKNIFVTLFDSGYLSRGLVMYESLKAVCKEFKLYIIAFDDKCEKKLKEANLDNTIIISLSDFEDQELLSVKDSRSRGEYCWTSTPKSILYIFENYNENICTYIDADMILYKDPSSLIEELGDDVVMITEHRYSDYCDQTKNSGKYCVQFMPFKNNDSAKNILNWWKDRCLENCGHDPEKGICGDQKYLDDWCERFEGVHELVDIGGGVAPWNVSQYSLIKDADKIIVKENATGRCSDLVFYHLHYLTFFDKDVVNLTGGLYKIPDSCILYVYKKYIRMHENVIKKYGLTGDSTWINEQHFRDDNDNLRHDRNFYRKEMFL